MSEWISVNESLPIDDDEIGDPTYEWVLVCCEKEYKGQYNKSWTIGRYTFEGWEFLYRGDEEDDDEVEAVYLTNDSCYMSADEITHWMPVPK